MLCQYVQFNSVVLLLQNLLFMLFAQDFLYRYSFFPSQYEEQHCSFEKESAVEFRRMVHLPYRDAFLL